jgi:hypothetical protein
MTEGVGRQLAGGHLLADSGRRPQPFALGEPGAEHHGAKDRRQGRRQPDALADLEQQRQLSVG